MVALGGVSPKLDVAPEWLREHRYCSGRACIGCKGWDREKPTPKLFFVTLCLREGDHHGKEISAVSKMLLVEIIIDSCVSLCTSSHHSRCLC
jgi:hypothetical protein